jgi:hypothetical protein
MNSDHFIVVQHRPRRVAFFVDADDSSDALFDEIVDFNVSSWGGRYNPVIPVLSGQVTEPYWQLLKLVNPDILYAYCELSTEVIKRIALDVRPLDVLRHNPSLQSPHSPFGVRLREQATVVPVLNRVMEQFPVWARKPEPAVPVFGYNTPNLSSFIRRNFGGNTHYVYWCRDHRIPSAELPPDDKEVMKAFTNNRNLVLPINVCAEGPRKLKASTADLGFALTLCYGASPWNFVEYWNLAHFEGEVPGVNKSLSEMWVQPALLEDRPFYEAFIELIRRRVFVSEHQPYLRLISYDEPEGRMREVTKRICEDFKWNMYPGEPVVRTKGELPAFEPRRVIGLLRPGSTEPRSKQVSGNSSFLELNPPTDAPRDCDERWIAEFAVENPGQERYFANKTAWWKLPRKNGVASLFVPHSSSRVGNDHLISTEVSGEQQGVMLNTPDLKPLFETLVLPAAAPAWAQKLDPTISVNTGNTFYIRSSDKGMYARGVLGLFESLQKAAYVFEHDFWRGIIESLSYPVASEHTRNKVRNDLERIGIDTLNSPSGLDLIVDEVLDTAGRIQRPTHYVNFNALFGRYWAYVKALRKEEQFQEIREIDPTRAESSDEKVIRDAARANLRDMLSEMTARKLFLHGAEVQCDHCLASLWYHVDDLQSVVTCRGCRKDLNLPAEIPWSYALNELVVSAVRDHGVAPVIRTAFRLFEGSRECFCFLPGIEIRDYNTNPETQVCELDLVWIRDGEFGIAEIKRAPKKFLVSKKLAAILDAAAPHRFLLVSASGTTSQMQEACSAVQAQVRPEIIVEAWSPDIFARSSHPGWNVITHSLFP